MKIEIRDFFKPIHFEESIDEEDYKQVVPHIQFAKSLSELTHQTIYLVDYYKKRFLYVSDNPIFLCGKSPTLVQQEGYLFYLMHVPEDDLEMLLKINIAGFSFFNNLPVEERTKYSITYDFHLKQPKGKKLLINHKLKPILLDSKLNPWIALCMVSLSNQTEAGHVKFRSNELKKTFELNLKDNKWYEKKNITLTNREKEILQLSVQGLAVGQIADKLKVSADTVRFHKKNIFSKFEVNNITEAVSAAMDMTIV